MKTGFAKIAYFLEKIGRILMIIGIIGWTTLAGSFFLNFFGVLSYDPPINRDAGNILRVELVDSSDRQKMEVVAELTGAKLSAFLEDFSAVRFKRHANDPPEPYGDRMIAVYYEDGSLDCIGEDMNERFDPAGKPISAKGWYYCPGNEMEKLFEKYILELQ